MIPEGLRAEISTATHRARPLQPCGPIRPELLKIGPSSGSAFGEFTMASDRHSSRRGDALPHRRCTCREIPTTACPAYRV